MQESTQPDTQITATVTAVRGMCEEANAQGSYHVECFGPDGKLKWVEDIKNLVTTVGRNNALDNHLGASGYTAAWYLGLIGATGYGAGPNALDTAASHAGWAEDTTYSEGARPTAAWSAAAAAAKAFASALVFSITGTTTIKGCFLISDATKGGSTGVLYSAGLFAADKPVSSGDTLNVMYTGTM